MRNTQERGYDTSLDGYETDVIVLKENIEEEKSR